MQRSWIKSVVNSGTNVNSANLNLVISSLLILEPLLSLVPAFDFQMSYAEDSLCFDYIATNRTIRVTCGSSTLNDVYDQIRKYERFIEGMRDPLEKESGGIWLLNANLVIVAIPHSLLIRLTLAG